MVLVQETPQCGKAPVGRIIVIPQPLRGGVGHHDIHPTHQGNFPFQPQDPAAHLGLGVLVLPVVIFPAASQAQDPQAVVGHYGIVNAVAALRGIAVVAAVVVSVDIQHRTPGHGHQEAEVFGVEIAAGQDQIKFTQPPRHIVIPQEGRFFIGYGQNLHSPSPSLQAECLGRRPIPGQAPESRGGSPQRAGWCR